MALVLSPATISRVRAAWLPLLALFTGLGMLAGCATSKPPAQSAYTGDLEGLEWDRDSRFDEVYSRPGVDLGQYSGLVLEPIAVALRRDEELLWSYRDSFFLPDLLSAQPQDQKFLSEYLDRAIRRSFGEEIVSDQPGERVLKLRATITGLVANRTPLDRGPVGSVFLTQRGVGSAAIQFELRDSQTGELLLAIADKRRGKSLFSQVNLNAAFQWGDAKEFFGRWASQLNARLGLGTADS